jgi:hypothetical protein
MDFKATFNLVKKKSNTIKLRTKLICIALDAVCPVPLTKR